MSDFLWKLIMFVILHDPCKTTHQVYIKKNPVITYIIVNNIWLKFVFKSSIISKLKMFKFCTKLNIFAICTDLAWPFLIDLDKKNPVITDIIENNIRLYEVFVGNQIAKWVTACPIHLQALSNQYSMSYQFLFDNHVF